MIDDIFEKYAHNLTKENFKLALQEAYASRQIKSYATHEEMYDNEVAPRLQEIGKICTDVKMPFVAVVEYSKGDRGTTAFLPETADLSMIMLNHCAKMGTNVDGYVMGLVKFAESKGIDYSSSYVMKAMSGKK